jgi:hypothetical protein
MSLTNSPDEKLTIEAHYYSTSLELKPRLILKAVLKHWSVETFHFSLGKSSHEDQCKIYCGHGAEVFSLLQLIRDNWHFW